MDIDDKEAARFLALGRMGIGAACMVMPRRVARIWLGRDADFTGRLALRGLGARDIAIGLGLLGALDRGTPVRSWLEAAAISDGADAVGTLSGWSELPNARRFVWLALEVGAVVTQLRLADSLD